MIDVVNALVKFGPAGLQVIVMYMMLKFFGDRQDRIIDAHERANMALVAALDKLTEEVRRSK